MLKLIKIGASNYKWWKTKTKFNSSGKIRENRDWAEWLRITFN